MNIKKIGIMMILIFGCLFLCLFEITNDNLQGGVEFAFYKNGKKVDTMPEKNNEEGVVFLRSDCTNGALVEWNYENWDNFKVINLSDSKTTCSFYFVSKEEKICNDSGLESAACYFANKEDDDLIYDDTKDTNLRYVGTAPNNYVYFNCDNNVTQSSDTCETWRIIGVMNNIIEVSEDGQNIEKKGSYLKIIRDKFETKLSWDSSQEDINWGYGINEWSTSAIGKVLNNEYLNRQSGVNMCFNNEDNSKETCPNWEEIGLKNDAKNMVANIKWNTGTFKRYNSSDWFVKAVYDAERSNYNGKRLCEAWGGGSMCNDNVDRTTTWTGKVGLMYPSDYGYAVGGEARETCLGKSMYSFSLNCVNWLYDSDNSAHQWTMTPIPNSSYADIVFKITSRLDTASAYYANVIRPTLYLKSDVKIALNAASDYGSVDNPFVLEYIEN